MPELSQKALKEVGRRLREMLEWMFSVQLEDPVEDHASHEGWGHIPFTKTMRNVLKPWYQYQERFSGGSLDRTGRRRGYYRSLPTDISMDDRTPKQ